MVFHCLTPFDYMAWQCGPWQLLGRDELQTLVARKVPGPDSWHGRLQPTMMLWCWNIVSLNVCKMPDSQEISLTTMIGYSMLFEFHNSHLEALGRYILILFYRTQGLSVSLNILPGLDKNLHSFNLTRCWRFLIMESHVVRIGHITHLCFLMMGISLPLDLFKPQTEKGNGESGWLWVLCNNKFIRLPLGS